MLKKLLKHEEKDEKESEKEKAIIIEGQEEEVEETVTFLTHEDKKAVGQVIDEVGTVVKEAAKESLKEFKLLEEGHCPECGRKMRQLRSVNICPFCGWSSYVTPEGGSTIVHLMNGATVTCESTFDAKDEILCITDQVVKALIPKANVNYIEYV